MVDFFRIPTYPSSDLFEAARYRLTWRIHIFLIGFFGALSLISLWTQPKFAVHYLISLCAVLFTIYYLKTKKRYLPVALILSIAVFALAVQSMFSIDEYAHFMEPLWLFLICLYIYFTGGKFYGLIYLVASIIVTVMFFFFRLESNVTSLINIDFEGTLTMAIEYVAFMSIAGYIIHQFVNTRRVSEDRMIAANEALLHEKEIVVSQNKEKTVLLQEIHHRVKNNLQVITSLLRIQSDKINSEEAREHFEDAINRVLTMSLIHEKIYQSDQLSQINPKDYFDALTKDLLRSTSTRHKIECKTDVEVEHLGLKTILPLALIITELISNSTKHAFSDTQDPVIDIRLRENTEKQLEMSYRDNGTWQGSTEGSFGTTLIETFTEQLDGVYELDISDNGTLYRFQISNLDL